MPSEASLAARQYYAHPRNAFWPLLLDLLGEAPTASYARRVAAAKRAGVAVWDVLASCRRPGSLDSAIVRDSERPNDIPALLICRPSIAAIAINGSKARQIFNRFFAQEKAFSGIAALHLPSTSPANAGMTFEQKREAWQAVLPFVQRK